MKPQLTSVLLTVSLTLSTSSAQAEPVIEDFSDDSDEALVNEALLSLSLEEVMTLEVTSVSRKKQRLMDSAAAIYVVTQEEIRRTGAKTIPDALRMVPGVQVAQLNSNTWSVSARGFNYVFANKLLVLMDGRTLYTPEFGGVNWDAQDTLMEDIDRIEVIRGPGAALWGANAMNGVINIITKSAAETQGSLLTLGGGTEEKLYGSYRHGGQWAEDAYYRAFFKTFQRDGFVDPEDGTDAHDDWSVSRAGFRMDWQTDGSNRFSVDGVVFRGTTRSPLYIFVPDEAGQKPFTDKEKEMKGGHIIGNWYRSTSDKGEFTLKAYYDRYENADYRITAIRDTVDIETQHRYQLTDNQELIWGLGYRSSWYQLSDMNFVSVDPDNPIERLYSAYIQDEIRLAPDWHLTLSSRLEHHTSTGYEFQPNGRIAWNIDPRTTVWASVSKAIRTPSISERMADVNGVFKLEDIPMLPDPTFLRLNENPELEAENLTAVEFGFRRQINRSLSIDVASFYNQYRDLHSLAVSRGCPVGTDLLYESFCGVNDPFVPPYTADSYYLYPATLANGLDAKTYGFEVSLDWQARDWWRIKSSYSLLQVKPSSTSNDLFAQRSESLIGGLSAEDTANIHSIMDFSNGWMLDTWIRYIGENDAAGIDAYTSLNFRLAWQYHQGLELSLTGNNLFNGSRLEFNEEITGLSATEVEEAWYAQVQWQF